MTTIDTGFSALPGADPVPQLAGLPSAAELSALANALFPDLTKDFETAGLKFEPTVCAEGIDKLVKTGDPSIVNTAAAKAETAYNHLAHSQGEPLSQAGVPVRGSLTPPPAASTAATTKCSSRPTTSPTPSRGEKTSWNLPPQSPVPFRTAAGWG